MVSETNTGRQQQQKWRFAFTFQCPEARRTVKNRAHRILRVELPFILSAVKVGNRRVTGHSTVVIVGVAERAITENFELYKSSVN